MTRSLPGRVTAVLALAAVAAGSGSGNTPTAQAANTLVARLYAPTHTPRVNAPWRIRITARTPSGTAVQADVRYQFLLNGQVVARRSHYRFRGTFKDTLTWPASAMGHRLTFRAVVSSKIGTRKLDYWVNVRR